jgi:TPR repeat protein
LGYVYFFGNDQVFEDKEEAKEWWLKSAGLGNYEAKYDLKRYFDEDLEVI